MSATVTQQCCQWQQTDNDSHQHIDGTTVTRVRDLSVGDVVTGWYGEPFISDRTVVSVDRVARQTFGPTARHELVVSFDDNSQLTYQPCGCSPVRVRDGQKEATR